MLVISGKQEIYKSKSPVLTLLQNFGKGISNARIESRTSQFYHAISFQYPE